MPFVPSPWTPSAVSPPTPRTPWPAVAAKPYTPVPAAAWIAEKAVSALVVTLTRVSVAASLSVLPTPVPSWTLPFAAALTTAGPASADTTTPPSAPMPAVMTLRRDVGDLLSIAIVASLSRRSSRGPPNDRPDRRRLDRRIVSGAVDNGIVG